MTLLKMDKYLNQKEDCYRWCKMKKKYKISPNIDTFENVAEMLCNIANEIDILANVLDSFKSDVNRLNSILEKKGD